MTPVEGNADGTCVLPSCCGKSNVDFPGNHTYNTNKTINGLIAQQESCAAVIIEHKFYGISNPYPDLTFQSLRFHTI